MNKNNEKIVVRFAPSPTGVVHLGTARTALFNFLFSKKNNGKYILRIEDTDKDRSKKEFEDNILETLSWLGLDFDELYYQSKRVDIYKNYIQQLITRNLAYISQEGISGSGDNIEKRDEVIRFRNPNKIVMFKDELRGNIQFDTTDLGDFVIAKSFEEPLYNFAVVVDDYEMGVTHIIRGEDHIPNTPRQILIQEAIGARLPIYIHLPLILGRDRSKLSKRDGALPVLEYRNAGYLPSTIVNYLAFLGWNPGNDKEVLTQEQLIEFFGIEGLQKSPAVFNEEKIDWLNRKHMALLSDDDFGKGVLSFLPKEVWGRYTKLSKRLLPFIRERISKFGDIRDRYDDEWVYFFERPEYLIDNLIYPPNIKKGESVGIIQKHLSFILDALSSIEENEFDIERIKGLVWNYATENDRGTVLWPMRFALSGKEKSLDPFSIAAILGKKETLERISIAIKKFSYSSV
ncbi:MAG: Glutamate--tRNA ligase [Parcubacteria group bacterium LiPW_30]|nr:MAG: Glutamate--tRNA ligase [Parcubacteria group bacterium LiPW_30]